MKNNYKNITIAFVFFVIGLISYHFIFTNKSKQEQDLSLFRSVWNTMEEKYPFTEPDNKDKEYAAIAGLVKSYGDDYSTFFSPKLSKQFFQDVTGSFGGAGMEISIRDGLLQVVAPLKNSPAEKAGFLPGDIITHIAGKETYGKNLNSIISEIRGEIGTNVGITILRVNDDENSLTLNLVRDQIKVPVLDTRIIDDTFIISLYNFNKNSEDNFKEAIQDFKKSHLKKMILDLRNNPGGYLDSAIDILSYFFDQGVVLVKEDFGNSGKKQRIHRSKGFTTLSNYDYTISVLVNSGSASASEIVSGALQDHKKATILGEQTYGKGSVQELIDLDQNTSLKVTTAKWLTPKGHQISKIGIEPDIFIDNINTTTEENIFHQVIDALKK